MATPSSIYLSISIGCTPGSNGARHLGEVGRHALPCGPVGIAGWCYLVLMIELAIAAEHDHMLAVVGVEEGGDNMRIFSAIGVWHRQPIVRGCDVADAVRHDCVCIAWRLRSREG